MAIEKVGIYRKWLGTVPKDTDGKPIRRSQWPRKRQYHWIVRWYGSNGKRYGKVFKTRKEAENCSSDLQEQVSLGRADKPANIRLHNFIGEHAEVMKGQVAYATLQDQIRALKLFENYIGSSITLCKIQPRHAEGFVAKRLASGLKIATVNKDIRTLRRIFNLAIEPRGYLAEGRNPFSKIKERRKANKPPRYVSVENYHALIKAAQEPSWKAIISVAYGSGLRRGEILNLTWADIDFENQSIRIAPKEETERTLEWEPKDHENRVVPMSAQAAQLLADLQIQSEEIHPYIFISPQRLAKLLERRKVGKWTPRLQTINNMKRKLDATCRQAGIEKCTLHDLRRSAITNWAKKLPIQVVQQLAGHSDITTTRQYYLSVRPEDLASANKLLNSILCKTGDD
jgi:integrase